MTKIIESSDSFYYDTVDLSDDTDTQEALIQAYETKRKYTHRYNQATLEGEPRVANVVADRIMQVLKPNVTLTKKQLLNVTATNHETLRNALKSLGESVSSKKVGREKVYFSLLPY